MFSRKNESQSDLKRNMTKKCFRKVNVDPIYLVGKGVLASAALTFNNSVNPDNLMVFMSNLAKTFSIQL